MSQKFPVAIITGGSRGLGRSAVLALAACGVDSILTYRANKSAADEVVALAEQTGAKAKAIQLNTANISAFVGFAEQVQQALHTWGAEGFDYLVNNAGNNHRNMPFDKTNEEELDSLYQVQFKGVFLLSQTLLPLIKDGGRILNVSTGRTRVIVPPGERPTAR